MTKGKEELSKSHKEGARKREEKRYNKIHRINNEGHLEKLCTVCKQWVLCDEEHFYKNKLNQSDGFMPYCKECNKVKSNNWRLNNLEKAKEMVSICHSTEEAKVKNKERNKAYRESGKALEYQRRNKDKLKQYRLNREMHKTHQINKDEWQLCKEYFNNCCAYCGLPIENHYKKYSGVLKNIDLHKEHVCDCGRNDLKNCIPSCTICNSTKKNTSFNDWYNPKNPVYTYERYHKICQWIHYDCKKYIMKKKPKGKHTKRILNIGITDDKCTYMINFIDT